MGVTTNTCTLLNGKTENIGYWCKSGYSTDASTAQTAIAAPGAGYALCIEQIDINCRVAVNITIQYDATPTILVGPFEFTTGGNEQMSFSFLAPIELPENTGLDIFASAATKAVFVLVQGFTRSTT